MLYYVGQCLKAVCLQLVKGTEAAQLHKGHCVEGRRTLVPEALDGGPTDRYFKLDFTFVLKCFHYIKVNF